MRFPELPGRNASPPGRPAASAAATLDPAVTQAIEACRNAVLPERIESEAEYAAIDREAQEAARYIRHIEAWFETPIAKAHAAHKELCDRRNELTKGLKAGVEARNRILLAYRKEWKREKGSNPFGLTLDGAPGASARENWQARVVDADAVPDEFWIVDVAKLTELAKRTKAASTIPGVVFEDAGTIARRV